MIGKLIKSERIKQGKKQNVLAKGICSASYLSKIENNQVAPNSEILQLLANRLNLNLDLTKSDIENHHVYHEEFFSIYKEVIQKRSASYTKEMLSYLSDKRSNYFSKETFFDFKILQLYLLLNIGTNCDEIDSQIAVLSSNVQSFDHKQGYLFEKCLGIHCYNNNQFSRACDAFDRAAQKLPFEHFGEIEKADLSYIRSLALLANNQYLQCIEYLTYPTQYFMNKVNFSRLIECLLIEGIAHQKLKSLEKAQEIYSKALNLAENLQYNNTIPAIYQNLGSVNSSLGNLEEALDYYFKSYEMKVTLEKQLITIFSIIQIYSKLENYVTMETWIDKGISLVENRERYRSYNYHFKLYYQLFIQLDDLKFIHEAISHFENIKDARHVYKYGIKVAEILKQQQKYKLATHYYERATFSKNQTVGYWEDL
ncbi:helix-turn-helix domain-containing protein [Solibacillus sp. MA9]|uniref:Helix-turn-helix domain-containing protein n=1 Tax=Solibacillus palustris TaxID=2908203 RepID=A0ABS9UAH8_9BACL|nr:helix-turn-helix domain-containing protein [Solibacillus sp. MA9]MCH7321336.1 helix-turn-helix domain-containing protein [Solibacillus sp. MA9]